MLSRCAQGNPGHHCRECHLIEHARKLRQMSEQGRLIWHLLAHGMGLRRAAAHGRQRHGDSVVVHSSQRADGLLLACGRTAAVIQHALNQVLVRQVENAIGKHGGAHPRHMLGFQEEAFVQVGNSTAHYGLGRAYYKQGLYDEALKELNTSLYQFRNSAPVHQTLGDVYTAQGNTVAGIKEYQESIRIKPENPDAYMRIADVREGRGDLEMSIAELRSGLEMMPNNADLHMRVADQSLKLEKLDDAIKEYRTVMDNNPQNSAAAKGLTRAYYLKANKEATGAFFVSNEFESAQRMIDQAVRMNPNDMELRLAQAKLRSMAGTPVDLSTVGTPTNDGERIAYAEALLAQNNFKDEDVQMNTVIANATDAKQAFAVADLALMIKDVKNAEAAYKKASSYPGAEERAKRGLNMVAKAKDGARQDDTLADDLARKNQLASAIDKYHASIYENPKVADTRLGIGKTLERLKPESSKDLKEAVVQYKAYMALSPDLPPKEVEKMNKKIESLSNKAYKVEQKEKERASR